MSIQKLDVYNVRNIRKTSILPSSAINLIYGDNGSGKSSLLEAIHILGRAQSFRTPSIKKVIHFDAKELIVAGRVLQSSGHVAALGVQLDGNDAIIHIDQQNVTGRAQLAYALPIQLVYPKSYLLLDGSPQIRREFIDWGVFNDYPEFLTAWRRFKKALTQRNALLKQKQFQQLEVWNHELQEYGTIVAEFRRSYIARLTPVFNRVIAQFLDFEQIDLQAFDGWDRSRDYLQVLQADLEKDSRYGFTQSGPHRGDFSVLIGSRHANEFVSRGQLKLLILALKLAQVELLGDRFRIDGCMLFDDMSAELDSGNRVKLMRFLSTLNVQIFMTAAQIEDFGDFRQVDEYRMFHMEHGEAKQV